MERYAQCVGVDEKDHPQNERTGFCFHTFPQFKVLILNVYMFRVKAFSSSETWMRVCGQSGRKGKDEQEKTAKRRCEWETRKRERQILWEEKGDERTPSQQQSCVEQELS